LHQNRFPGHSPCYIDNIAFLGAAAAAVVIVAADYYYSSAQQQELKRTMQKLAGLTTAC
jgi:TPP-dependent indolepyruvate ferredoxin oxidoreductase alpha subunit